LLERLPGLGEHGCSLGRPGGFAQRMHEGTWIGHVTEHVALEIQKLAGTPVSRGKTRSVKGRPGVYNIMYAYHDELVGLGAGRIALELVSSLLPGECEEVAGLDLLAKASERAEHDEPVPGLAALT